MEKALFWDFDGTLALSTSSADYLHTALKNQGYAIPFDEVVQHARAGFTWNIPEKIYIDYTGEKWWSQLFNHLKWLYNKYEVDKEKIELINSDFKNYVLTASSYTLYKDTPTTLALCTSLGYKNYILSNNFPDFSLVIKGLGLSKYFENYIISSEIGYEKPRLEIFRYALLIAKQPEICYMIGDNPIADIKGAKDAGMKTILVHKEGEYDTDYRCENLSQIPLLLAHDAH